MNKPTSRHLQACLDYYYWLCLAKGQSSDTVRGKKSGLKKFCSWAFSCDVTTVDDISLDLMDEYHAYLNAYRQDRNDQPLSAAHKRNLLTYVKTFVQYMYRKQILTQNPLADIELPSRGMQLPTGLYTVTEIELILSQTLMYGMRGLRDRVILEVLYATGIRRGELIKLNVDDIDFEQELLRVTGKRNRQRLIPISVRALEWLVLYLAKIRPYFASIESRNALFIANNGKRYREGKVSDMASQYIKLAGIDRPGACHIYRHASATQMLENDADLRHVQEFLGHADISTTQIYTHVSRAKLSAVYRKSHPSAQSSSGLFDSDFGSDTQL